MRSQLSRRAHRSEISQLTCSKVNSDLTVLVVVEGNRTDFSIVAPKDQNELYCSQSEFDFLGPMRDRDFKGTGQRSMNIANRGRMG